jgi:hypothetical protein
MFEKLEVWVRDSFSVSFAKQMWSVCAVNMRPRTVHVA